MAKFHHKGTTKAASEPEKLLAAIEAFVAACRNPGVVELGEDLLRLIRGEYALEIRSGRLSLEVWSGGRTFSRRILGIERKSTGVLECTVQRFGGAPAKLNFLDLDRPQAAHKMQAAERCSFGEQFRRMLFRQFPGWSIAHLSASMDLQRSFSPVFPRARLTKGQTIVAAMACPTAEEEPALLTFALIWFNYVRANENPDKRVTLALFLPDGAGALTAHRLHWLDAEKLETAVFRYNSHGLAGQVDPRDLGNIETRVASQFIPSQLSSDVECALRELASLEDVACVPELNGTIGIRFRGVPFGQVKQGRFWFGIGELSPVMDAPVDVATRYIRQLESLGSSPSPILGGKDSERWLESVVRANLSVADPSLLPEPVHGQVLTFLAGDRDAIDLLAVSNRGRLAVLELKASEDIHLPMQSLDYWIRIRWHAGTGELQHLFPGIVLDTGHPKLLLIAPALSFHSANATIIRYFSPTIEVERIGIGSNWKQRLQVALRLRGADSPISHGSAHEFGRDREYSQGRHGP